MFTAEPEQLFKFYLHAFAKQRYPGLRSFSSDEGSDEFNGGYISHALGRKDTWTPADWGSLDNDLKSMATARAARMSGLVDSDADLILSGVLDRSSIGGAGSETTP